MSPSPITKFLNPWKYKRDEQKRRFEALRQRDGDNCRRCRRPMDFDLPVGRDQAPAIEPILPRMDGGGGSALDNLCLCHVRCNADAGDATP
jgi:5-methylcytosine-specific restriction endonuclease McrA